MSVDQTEVSKLVLDLVRVGEDNGVKFPREFGLLLKQLLYFDRYVQLLAPNLDVVSQDRMTFMDTAAARGGRGGGARV